MSNIAGEKYVEEEGGGYRKLDNIQVLKRRKDYVEDEFLKDFSTPKRDKIVRFLIHS